MRQERRQTRLFGGDVRQKQMNGQKSRNMDRRTMTREKYRKWRKDEMNKRKVYLMGRN